MEINEKGMKKGFELVKRKKNGLSDERNESENDLRIVFLFRFYERIR